MNDQKEGTLTTVGDFCCGMVWANLWVWSSKADDDVGDG